MNITYLCITKIKKTIKIMCRINISQFDFQYIGHGHYKVTYYSPNYQKSYTKTINDMTIIDKTKNSEQPKQIDLQRLRMLLLS